MENNKPLLPFSFDISKATENGVPLSTLPREKQEIDSNAGGTKFHTRGGDTKRKHLHDASPQRSSRKTRKYFTSDLISSDDIMADNIGFPGTSTQTQTKPNFQMPSFNTYPSSESLSARMPSSPPIDMHSHDEDEDEFNPMADKSFILPSSPQHFEGNDEFQIPSQPRSHNQNNHAGLSARALTLKSISNPFFRRTPAEEFDFGLDKFNRVHGVHSDQPSSEMEEPEDSSQHIARDSIAAHARQIISQCFENQKTEVHLENLELSSIPEEIEDFKDLVLFDTNGGIMKPKLHLYISHNLIKSITPRLFELKNLVEVLSVRANKIKSIPGAISKLADLSYLNVVSNSIQVLPHAILRLPNLQRLLLRPNPSLLEVHQFKSIHEVKNSRKSGNNCKRYVGRLRYVNRHEHSINPAAISMTRNLSTLSQIAESEYQQSNPTILNPDTLDEEEQKMLSKTVSTVPRLSELCLRKFAAYKTSKSETKKWSQAAGLSTSKLIAKALHAGAYNETCAMCDHFVVQYVAEALEWWDIAETTLVPIRKGFCSGRCVAEWLSENKSCFDQSR